MTASSFFWYELVTADPKAAADFYAEVVGWKPVPFQGAQDYTVLTADADHGMAGIMAPPPGAEGMPAQWMGYLHADDVDAKAGEITASGGKLHKGPQDIPGVGRFAVFSDPQGSPFMVMKPSGEDQPPLPPMSPGTIGWHELSAADPAAAWGFYSGLFGWTKGDVIPMGEMGDYALFHAGSEAPAGAMMKAPPQRNPGWLFYFVVPAIGAARERIVKAGGTVTMEPMEVPGGGWAMEGVDPQGAAFGLTSPSA